MQWLLGRAIGRRGAEGGSGGGTDGGRDGGSGSGDGNGGNGGNGGNDGNDGSGGGNRDRSGSRATATRRRAIVSALARGLRPGHRCLFCDEAGTRPVCRPCLAALPGWRVPRCRACGARCAADGTCTEAGHCPGLRSDAVRIVAAADYAAPLDAVLLALKFGGRIDRAAGLGWLVAEAVRSIDVARAGTTSTPATATAATATATPTAATAAATGTAAAMTSAAATAATPPRWCVVPMPMSPRRLAERGLNHAAEIAGAMRAWLPERCDDGSRLLLRPGEAAPQHRLARAQRLRNAHGRFVARPGCAGRDVLLVDDVATTGATVQACATALLAAGARSVTAVVVARTGVPGGDRTGVPDSDRTGVPTGVRSSAPTGVGTDVPARDRTAVRPDEGMIAPIPAIRDPADRVPHRPRPP